MKKYRKKPVVIEAIQYKGAENLAEVMHFADTPERPCKWNAEDGLKIETLEGTHLANIGDYIIRGIQGEFYPCKPDIFRATYDDVDAPLENMTFGMAVEAIKKGMKVARSGWNGVGMFVYYVAANSYPVSGNPNSAVKGMFPDDMVPYRAYMALKTAQNDIASWSPSGSDALADDWMVVK